MAERKAAARPAARKAAAKVPHAGKHLSEAAMELVMRALPDELVREITAASALLIQAASKANLPLRIGVGYGPTPRAYADYFGRTVNIASRLSDQARAGEILVLKPEAPIPAKAWDTRGLSVEDRGRKRRRGVDGRVSILRVASKSHIRV